MDLATELAMTCLRLKQAGDEGLPAVRGRFEESARKEKLLRAHAERLRALSRAREEREDTSASGYAQTGLGRLLPIPHTGPEALLRLPLTGLGAYLGYQHGKSYEPLDPNEVKRVFSPASSPKKDKGGGAPGGPPGGPPSSGASPIERRLRDLYVDIRGTHPAQVAKLQTPELELLMRKLRLSSGEALSGALAGERRLPDLPMTPDKIRRAWGERALDVTKGEHAALRQEIENVFGAKNIGRVRGEVANVMGQTATKPGPIAELIPKIRWHGVGGALAGAGLVGALTGLPFAIRALLQKHKGGEGAERARAEAQEAIEQAENMSEGRGRLLAKLQARRDPEGLEAARAGA
jgi:hypothetical protein